MPFGFVYPYGLPKEMVLNTISIPRALNWGGTGSFVLFSSLAWLSRHHLPEEHAAYELDLARMSADFKDDVGTDLPPWLNGGKKPADPDATVILPAIHDVGDATPGPPGRQ